MAALLVILGLVAVYLVGGALYAVTLHPLADIPGPKLCAISHIPYYIQFFQGQDVQWMERLHDQYGPALRFSPNDVGYTAVQAWDDVFGLKVSEKAQDFSVQPINGVPSMLTATPANHSRVRRIFSPAFSERALRQQEPLFRKYINLLVDQVRAVGNAGDRAIDIGQLLNFTTFDVMAELCFGEPLNLLATNEYSPWVRSIFDMVDMLPVVSMINYYPVLKWLFDSIEIKSVTEQRIAHCKHSEDRVNRRLERGSVQPDVWNLVEDKDLSLQEMHSNAELFMLAGSETTATLLSGALYLLLKHPHYLADLTKSLRSTFASSSDLSFAHLAADEYLNAVVRETLRVYPPVPIGSPRVVQAAGQTVLGKHLPRGTRISVHHWSTYHSAANFHKPDTFAPERWMKSAGPEYAGEVSDAHKPFGFGPRDCLGQNMALHEIRLVLAYLLWEYDFELCPDSEGWLAQKAKALWLKKPLVVKATPVKKST